MDIASVQKSGYAAPVQIPAPDTGSAAANREIVQAVSAVNGAELLGHDNELTFQLDRQTQRLVVRIVNRETNEVVRQIPPEYVLNLAAEVRKQRAGGR